MALMKNSGQLQKSAKKSFVHRTGPPQTYSLYVGNLPQHIKEDALRKEFSSCGNITEMKLHRMHGSAGVHHAFIHYSTLEEALNTLSSKEDLYMLGRKIKVTLAHDIIQRDKQRSPRKSRNGVVVPLWKREEESVCEALNDYLKAIRDDPMYQDIVGTLSTSVQMMPTRPALIGSEGPLCNNQSTMLLRSLCNHAPPDPSVCGPEGPAEETFDGKASECASDHLHPEEQDSQDFSTGTCKPEEWQDNDCLVVDESEMVNKECSTEMNSDVISQSNNKRSLFSRYQLLTKTLLEPNPAGWQSLSSIQSSPTDAHITYTGTLSDDQAISSPSTVPSEPIEPYHSEDSVSSTNTSLGPEVATSTDKSSSSLPERALPKEEHDSRSKCSFTKRKNKKSIKLAASFALPTVPTTRCSTEKHSDPGTAPSSSLCPPLSPNKLQGKHNQLKILEENIKELASSVTESSLERRQALLSDLSALQLQLLVEASEQCLRSKVLDEIPSLTS